MFGVGTERTTSTGEILSRRNDGLWCDTVLYPVDDRAEHVEMVESRGAAAVSHTGHQEDAARLGHLLGAAVRCSQRFVIIESIERREPRIAVAVEEDELATGKKECGQIGGRWLDERVGSVERRFVYVNFCRRGVGAEEAVRAKGEKTWGEVFP